MEIKIQCPCNQHYAFDVEPVNGLMPCAISCPACGADGTQLANQFIHETQAAAQPAPAPASGGLRINRPAAVAPVESNPGAAATPATEEKAKRYGYTRTLEPDKAPPP